MRLKFGLLFRGSLLVSTIFVLFVFWSLFLPDNDQALLSHVGAREASNSLSHHRHPNRGRFQTVIPLPRVSGDEVDLESIRKKWRLRTTGPAGGSGGKSRDLRSSVTFKPHAHVYHEPVLKQGTLGNFELRFPETQGVLKGPGEDAVPLVLGEEHKKAIESSIREFGFNMVASDMISLDRRINDLRHDEYWHYDENLLTASVVIVFHNEGWSTLLRTVHSVVKRTPPRYLAEIVLIDDDSSKKHLKAPLEEYIQRWNGLVKIFRTGRREGLIQARSIGAQKATEGQVLIYLDAHCEVSVNWFAPLIAPISKDRTVSTVPLIDVISGQTFETSQQGGGDKDGLARGAWDWSLLWKRVPLSDREKERRKTKTEPYRSPAMAGGLFAIERDFFFELGLYDPGLQIWGGENFEISFKIWQCGGQVLFVPCSRVGHIYRQSGWQGNPPPPNAGLFPTLKNYVRVVEVWWDEYRDFFYASRPDAQMLPSGDISPLQRFRQDHGCQNFSWFMKEIAYDIIDHYPLPSRNLYWGEVRGFGSKSCIDSMGRTHGAAVEMGPCHRMGGNQLFRMNEAHQMLQYDLCLTVESHASMVILIHCSQNQYSEWTYQPDLLRFTHIQTGKCLDRSETKHTVYLSNCQPGTHTQRWEFNKVIAGEPQQ